LDGGNVNIHEAFLNEALFSDTKSYVSLQSIFWGTLDVEMINKNKVRWYSEDVVVPYIATPDYEYYEVNY
jgi:hypothetical protein